ncbi:MAG: gas vesicle protein GvpO [Patescibacteria group bacterium]
MTKKTNQAKKTDSQGIDNAMDAIKKLLGKECKIINLNKTDQGWEIEVETIEVSEHMKKIGIPKPVYDKNVYQVVLNQDFEVIRYQRKESRF